MLANLLVTPPPHPPTRHAMYSCWNYLLLSLILEKITGEKLPDFCRREIFEPLAMNSTSLGKPLPEIPLERLGKTIGTSCPGEISDFVIITCRHSTLWNNIALKKQKSSEYGEEMGKNQ